MTPVNIVNIEGNNCNTVVKQDTLAPSDNTEIPLFYIKFAKRSNIYNVLPTMKVMFFIKSYAG